MSFKGLQHVPATLWQALPETAVIEMHFISRIRVVLDSLDVFLTRVSQGLLSNYALLTSCAPRQRTSALLHSIGRCRGPPMKCLRRNGERKWATWTWSVECAWAMDWCSACTRVVIFWAPAALLRRSVRSARFNPSLGSHGRSHKLVRLGSPRKFFSAAKKPNDPDCFHFVLHIDSFNSVYVFVYLLWSLSC